MWKKNSHLPEHIDDENPLFKSTVVSKSFRARATKKEYSCGEGAHSISIFEIILIRHYIINFQ